MSNETSWRNGGYFYLFGKEACDIYLQNIGTDMSEEEIARRIKNTTTYGLYHYDESEDSPNDLLRAYDGWQAFADIDESFYNLLKTN